MDRTPIDPDLFRVAPDYADSVTLKQYLDAHRLVWDMPSLGEIYPEILYYLAERYLLRFLGDDVVVSYLKVLAAPEFFDIGDARYVIDVLLSREYRAALIEERFGPAIARLGV